jgi:hypothetical protein
LSADATGLFAIPKEFIKECCEGAGWYREFPFRAIGVTAYKIRRWSLPVSGDLPYQWFDLQRAFVFAYRFGGICAGNIPRAHPSAHCHERAEDIGVANLLGSLAVLRLDAQTA